MNLIGENVTSARYGIGTITSIDSGYMTIQFDERMIYYYFGNRRYSICFWRVVPSQRNSMIRASMI